MKAVFIVTMVLALMFACDTVSSIAREFEHNCDDVVSKREIEKITDTPNTPAVTVENSKYHSMIATAYCIDGNTATGTHTRQGIAAGKREWFGKTAKVYRNDNGAVGDLIGQYVIEDTGGTPIQNGSVIDIWFPTYDDCMNFGRRLVYVEIVD